MAKTYPWVFTQLSGDKKKLTLDNRDAPLGRPRRHPVVEDGAKIVQAVTRYAGNRVPTRHIFTDAVDDYELNGRFQDSYGGNGYAKRKRDFVKAFCSDHQQVQIEWGPLLFVRGTFVEWKFGIESEGQITYKLVIGIDEDPAYNMAKHERTDVAPPTPRDFAAAIKKAMGGSIFDTLDDIVSAVNEPIAGLVAIADQMESWEKQGIGSIRRFRAGLNQAQTAMVRFQATLDALQADTVQQTEYAKENIKFWSWQTERQFQTMLALRAVAEADKQADIAERGKTKGFVDAKPGDSWEALSRRSYDGSSDRAQDLRDANGAAAGAAPAAGTTYVVPV